MREAAALAGISGPGWLRLEKTRETVAGRSRVIGHSRETVIKAAEALGWDVAEALRLAGHKPISGTDPAAAGLLDVEDTSRPVNAATGSRTGELLGLIRDIAATPASQIGEVVMVIRWVLALSPSQRQHLLGFVGPVSDSGRQVVNEGLDVTPPEPDDDNGSTKLNGA